MVFFAYQLQPASIYLTKRASPTNTVVHRLVGTRVGLILDLDGGKALGQHSVSFSLLCMSWVTNLSEETRSA